MTERSSMLGWTRTGCRHHLPAHQRVRPPFFFRTIGLSCALNGPFTFPQVYYFEIRMLGRSDNVNQSVACVSCWFANTLGFM